MKPTRKSSLSGLAKTKDAKQAGEKQERRVVSTGVNKRVTSNKPPLSLRTTEDDDKELVNWLNDVSRERGKNVTPAKLFRALIHMRQDINMKKLVEAIKDIG